METWWPMVGSQYVFMLSALAVFNMKSCQHLLAEVLDEWICFSASPKIFRRQKKGKAHGSASAIHSNQGDNKFAQDQRAHEKVSRSSWKGDLAFTIMLGKTRYCWLYSCFLYLKKIIYCDFHFNAFLQTPRYGLRNIYFLHTKNSTIIYLNMANSVDVSSSPSNGQHVSRVTTSKRSDQQYWQQSIL